MITGAIALLFGIVGYFSFSKGNTGTGIVCVVIVILALAIGSASREEDRALNNIVDHWANGEGKPPASQKQTKREKQIKEQIDKKLELQQFIRDERRKANDLSCVDGIRTAGRVMKVRNTTRSCPVCGTDMKEFNRIQYSSGTVYVNYKCRRCGKTLPVKVR